MREATIQDLAYLISQAKRENQKQPIVFLGAGASKTGGIPLAGEIVEDILKDYSDTPRVKRLAFEKRTYPELMECLTPFSRNELLKKYIDRAKINVTHIYLAQLLTQELVDYVLTVNFDNLMLRALALFNEFPPTYDLAVLKDLTTTTFKEKSVIYLHGQHHGLWLLNTKEELSKVSSVVSPILNSIKDRPWIFIGYSGNDPIFNQIVKLGRFDKGLYWVNYQDHIPEKHVCKNLLDEPNTNAFIIKGFDADLFMFQLNHELGLPQPKIIEKPFSSLIEQLNNIVDIDDAEQYSKVKQRLNIAKWEVESAIKQYEKYDLESFNLSDPSEVESNQLKKEIINQIIDQRFDENDINELEQKVLKIDDDDLHDMLSSLYADWGISLYKSEDFKKNKDLFLKCISKYEKALEINPNDALTYLNLGTALHDRAKRKKDADLYRKSIKNYELAVRNGPNLDSAFNNLGTALSELGKLENDEDLYKQSFEKYKIAADINPKDDSIFYNWGNSLQEFAKIKRSSDLLKESLKKFDKAAILNPTSSTTYNNWGLALSELAMLEKSEQIFQISFARFKEATELDTSYFVAYNNWGNALWRLGNLKSNAYLYYESIKKYKYAIDLNPDYYRVYNNLGNALAKLAMLKEDEELFKESFEEYQKAIKLSPDNPFYYHHWGGAILELAVLKNDSSLIQESQNKLQKAIDLGGSPYNLACLYARQDDKTRALKYLSDSLKNNFIKANFVIEDEDWKAFYDDSDFINLIEEYQE